MGKRMAKARDYDAYFVDLNMPGGCGADVIPVIQKRNPMAPIMIITGRCDDEAIGLSSKYGVAYVEKPFDPNDLKRFVNRAVFGKTVH
jgi:DNA-binding NtrC family response regulator